MNQERPKIKGIAFVALGRDDTVDYTLADLEGKLVYDVSHKPVRPVYVDNEGSIWVRENESGVELYHKFRVTTFEGINRVIQENVRSDEIDPRIPKELGRLERISIDDYRVRSGTLNSGEYEMLNCMREEISRIIREDYPCIMESLTAVKEGRSKD